MLNSEQTQQLRERIKEPVIQQTAYLAREQIRAGIHFPIWRRMVPSNRLLIRLQAEEDCR